MLDMFADKDLIDSMIKSFEMPTYEEFDSIEFRFSFQNPRKLRDF